MTDINILIKRFVYSKKHSREERKVAYELACMACDLYAENERLKAVLNHKNQLLYPIYDMGVICDVKGP